MSILDQIDTIVVVMMENRSFDHMLGYLSHPAFGNRKFGNGKNEVDGQTDDTAWLNRYRNTTHGVASPPFPTKQLALTEDPPHERRDIRVQIGAAYPWGESAPMTGFMASYATNPSVPVSAYREVMGFLTPNEAPVTSFLAENFTICDRWFACLPASTQPNRLMAMSGLTMIDNTLGTTVPYQDLVYDWCDRQSPQIRWRVYHEGWPFFMVMNERRLEILNDAFAQSRFRRFDKLTEDFCSKDPFPELVFVEPKYTDDPFSAGPSCDDHPPTSIAGGQDFLKRVYSALTSNRERWNRTVMIVTYDENGGFFDHVSPLPIPTSAPDGSYAKFDTTGVRVPAFVVSPLVRARGVYSEPLDHTSILRFIAERFGDGHYSHEVDNRPLAGSISDLLVKCAAEDSPRNTPPPPDYDSKDILAHLAVNRTLTLMSQAFAQALIAARKEQPEKAAQKFPELAEYFKSEPVDLWHLAKNELDLKGFVLNSTCAAMMESFLNQAQLKLMQEPTREKAATASVIRLVNRMIAETHGGKTIEVQQFESARRALMIWPFL